MRHFLLLLVFFAATSLGAADDQNLSVITESEERVILVPYIITEDGRVLRFKDLAGLFNQTPFV